MGNPPPKWIVSLGSDVPAISEYLDHPDHRQYATFFLGWLFVLSLVLFLTSPTLSSILLRLKRALYPLNIETRSTDTIAEKSIPTTTSSNKSDALSLVFLLNLLILTTTATQFASLLAFNSSNGETSCIFLTAWNGLGLQAVRLVGFLKLGLHLKELGARKWESWLLWGLLLFSAVLTFLTNAVSTGILQPIPGINTLSFCYRKHYAFTAGLTSAINLFIELYFIARFLTLQLPFFLIRHDRRVFADLRLLRALSLLLLDILTVFPSIHFVNIAADYIPSALGMIPVLLAFSHQPSRGYSLSSPSPSSRWSTKSTNLAQPSASIGTSVQSLSHILPMHTPPSTFGIQSSEFHSDSPSPSYQRPQIHPFGAIALREQSPLSGNRYPRRAAMDTTRPESPAVNLLSAVSEVDSKSPIVDASSISWASSSMDEENPIRISTSTRRSFLPALPTMAWGADAEVPSDVEPVQPPPTAAANAPTSALVPRTRHILPNQAAVAAELPRGRDPSTSSAAVVLVPLGTTWQPRIALSGKPVSTVLEQGRTSKDPGHDAAMIPPSPSSIVYGSDILCPSGEPVNVMKQSYSTSTRSKQVSYATTAQRTSTSSFVGAWSTRLSAIEPMALNYPTLPPPPSPGNGESTASSGTTPGSRRPSMVDDASRRLEGGVKRPNTFGKESFLDFNKVLFTGSRASSTKTKSSNRSSRSTDRQSRSHSETDESAGTGKRDKGKGPRKARRTPVGGGGASNGEPARRSMDLPPPPPQKTAPEDATT